jgi:hypothetical protein
VHGHISLRAHLKGQQPEQIVDAIRVTDTTEFDDVFVEIRFGDLLEGAPFLLMVILLP